MAFFCNPEFWRFWPDACTSNRTTACSFALPALQPLQPFFVFLFRSKNVSVWEKGTLFKVYTINFITRQSVFCLTEKKTTHLKIRKIKFWLIYQCQEKEKVKKGQKGQKGAENAENPEDADWIPLLRAGRAGFEPSGMARLHSENTIDRRRFGAESDPN